MLLTPKELAALKAMATGNLESALMASARFGATKSAEAAKPIKRAAEMLEYDAEELRECHHLFGQWECSEAKQDYDERKKVARALRGLVG